MIKRILVGVGQSPAQTALAPIVMDIAARNQAEVTGMALIDREHLAPSRPPTTGVFQSKIKEGEDILKAALEDIAGPVRNLRESAEAQGVAFQEIGIDTDLVSAVGNAWQFQDLLVLSSHPWLGGEKAPRDVTAVLRFLVAGIRPILAVPGFEAKPRKKAMVALSGSLESAKAMKHFVQLGLWPEMTLHLVTVGSPKNGEAPDRFLAGAADYVKAHGLEATTSVLEAAKDRSAALLSEAAAVEADTLILGSSYRRFLAMERFGTHAQELLEKFDGALFLSH